MSKLAGICAIVLIAFAQSGTTHYTETIPGTTVTFDMLALPGGTFMMGSQNSEPERKENEGPAHRVTVSPFWIGKTEVTWDEYEQFYFRVVPPAGTARTKADAVTKPTSPYGAPDQGWGRGKRPAMSMTWHGANQYCVWLSALTGKKYRLPTSAEWEYACRASSQEPYSFGKDTTRLGDYAWYLENANQQTHPTAGKKPNAFGLYDMLGNVGEFCSDFHSDDDYRRFQPEGWPKDPSGPEAGEEHVVRGGSYFSRPSGLRSAARERTQNDDWLMTDPNEPKSKWWYSDCFFAGFRVVRTP